MKKIISIMILIMIFLAGTAVARDIQFTISLSSENVAPGRQARLKLIFFDNIDIPAPSMPIMEGVNFRYRGSSVEEHTQDGRTAESMVYTYSVVPLTTGIFKIGPITFNYKDDTYNSNAVSLTVGKQAPVAAQKTPDSGKADMSERIYLDVDLPEGAVYVNQKVPVVVRFYTDWLDIEDLEISDAPGKYHISEKYNSGGTSIQVIGGDKFAVLKFNKWFFIPEAGEFEFGPVRAKCDVAKAKDAPLNDNLTFYNTFIGKRDKRSFFVEKGPFKINVLPLPSAGRPTDFRGAVGRFKMDTSIDHRDIKPGEIVTLTIRISGDGNFKTVNAPRFEETEDMSVYDPAVTRNADSVVIKQPLKIRSSSVKEVPETSFSFFDPAGRKYVTLRKAPVPITVEAVKKEESPIEKKKVAAKVKLKKEIPAAAEPEMKEDLGAGIIYLKDFPGKLKKTDPYFYRTKGFIFLQFFPLVLLGSAIIIHKRLNILTTDTAYAGWLAASREARANLLKARLLMRKKSSKEFYDHIFLLMQTYIGKRLTILPDGITEEIIDVIKPKIDREDIPEKIKEIFGDCYLARFTSTDPGKAEMKNTFVKVKEVIEYMNGKRRL